MFVFSIFHCLSFQDLLAYFLEHKAYDCFAACLFQCYDLLHPDVILELAWKHNIMDFAMPYLIQVMREYTTKVDKLEEAETQRATEAKEENSKPIVMETQPQLMLGYGGTAAPPSAGAFNNTYAGMPSYQGYSM